MAFNISVSAGFKTECESYRWYDQDGTALKVVKTYCKFDGTNWTEITAFVKTIDIANAVNNATGMPTANRATITLDNDDKEFSDLNTGSTYYDDLKPHKEVKVEVTVTSETVAIFTGRVDPKGFQENYGAATGTATINCMDPSVILQNKKFDKDFVYTGDKLFDASDTGNSLIHTLLTTHGGFEVADVATTSGTMSYTVNYAHFKQGQSVWQAIQKIAEASATQYCGFRHDGKFIFDSRLFTGWTDYANEYTITGNTYEISLRKDLLPLVGNKIKVRGSEIIAHTNTTVLWELRKVKEVGGNATYPNMCWETVADDAYFLCDLDADPPKEYYAQYEIPGEEIISVSSVTMTQTTEEAGELTETGTLLTKYPRRGRLVLQNLTGAALHIKNIVITGAAVTKRTLKSKEPDEEALEALLIEQGLADDDANWGRAYAIEAGISINDYGQKDWVISSDYVVDDAQMEDIADYMFKYGKDPRHQFTLSGLPFMCFLQPGAVITFNASDLGWNGECDLTKVHHSITPDGAATTITLIERENDWDPTELATESTGGTAAAPSLVMAGGSASSTGLPIVSGGKEPVDYGETASVPGKESISTDYHFIESDLPVAGNTHFGGHIMFLNETAAIDSDLTLVYLDAETDRDVIGDVKNVDISSFLPTGVTPTAAMVLSTIVMATAVGKLTNDTIIQGYVYYSLVYNSKGDDYQAMNHLAVGAEDPSNDSWLKGRMTSQAMVPVVYDSGTPYITWFSRIEAADMNSTSTLYGVTTYLYLIGILQ